jgi:CMP/dCMP kinase
MLFSWMPFLQPIISSLLAKKCYSKDEDRSWFFDAPGSQPVVLHSSPKIIADHPGFPFGRLTMAVITISRQYASGGDEIADRVCQVLGYRHFDRRQIARAALNAGFSNQDMGLYSNYSEENYQYKKFVDFLIQHAGPHGKTGKTNPFQATQLEATLPEEQHFNEASALTLVQTAIKTACQTGNFVIVGRGGQAILKGAPGVLHLRIEAPLERRIHRVQDLLKEEQQAYYPGKEIRRSAKDLVAERDKSSADYIRHFYGVDWSDPYLYHAVFNMGKFNSLEDAAQVIIQMVQVLFPAGS